MSATTVELAYKYGPFLFGILLVTTAVKMVRKGGPSKGLAWLFSVSAFCSWPSLQDGG